MEDSLENYLKLSRNAKAHEPTGIKEEVKLTALRKKECDDQALKIVHFSIEGRMRPDIFIRCLPFLNPSYYQDIIEERAITKLCGYPICGKQLPDLPKQKYYISTKSNKIYDITDRKNFCSNICYEASLHIKKQIDSSPLWLRRFDKMPEYQLLASNKGGLPGECVDQGIAKPVVDSSFTSVSAFAEVSLDDLVDKEKGGGKSSTKEKTKGTHKKVSKLIKTMQTISENTEQLEEEEEDAIVMKGTETEKSHSPSNDRLNSVLPVIIENEENIDTKIDTKSEFSNLKSNCESSVKVNTRKPKKKNVKTLPKIDPEIIIKKAVKEWITLETYIFIYGEKKVKEIFNEKKMSDYFEELKIGILKTDQQIKYMELCKRLHLQEMADQKFDNTVIGNTKLKPLPDFQKLKEESKELNLSVKCFYSGVLREKEDPNFTAKGQGEELNNDEGIPAVLPLVDVNSQRAMRRKIFLNAANKSVQNLLQVLRVRSFAAVQSDIQALVKTFKLRADNIVFSPLVWNFIAILLLKILALKDQNIKKILDDAASQKFIKLQLTSLCSKGDFITDIMSDIQNVEMFVEHYISCN